MPSEVGQTRIACATRIARCTNPLRPYPIPCACYFLELRPVPSPKNVGRWYHPKWLRIGNSDWEGECVRNGSPKSERARASASQKRGRMTPQRFCTTSEAQQAVDYPRRTPPVFVNLFNGLAHKSLPSRIS